MMSNEFESPEEGVRLLSGLIEKEPGVSEYYVRRGHLHEELIKEHFDSAQKDFRQAAKLDSFYDGVNSLRDQFRCLLFCGGLDEVIGEFTKSIENRKICIPLLEGAEKRFTVGRQISDLKDRAIANYMANRFGEAVTDISEAIRLLPHSGFREIDTKNYIVRALAAGGASRKSLT